MTRTQKHDAESALMVAKARIATQKAVLDATTSQLSEVKLLVRQLLSMRPRWLVRLLYRLNYGKEK